MRVDIVSIFPEYFAPLDLSLIGRARANGTLRLAVHDLRQWTYDVHRTVDDTPYGGGPGMVMRPEPWGEALDALAPMADHAIPGDAGGDTTGPGDIDGPSRLEDSDGPSGRGDAEGPSDHERAADGTIGPGDVDGSGVPHLVVPGPAGVPFNQALAYELAAEQHLIFACGRYEGIDQRVLDHAATRMRVTEVSLGDYVLFGGEVAVLVIMEAVTRLLPGVLGNAASLDEESHAHGLLEGPVYTKPPVWREHEVPELLRSGDHGRIARWRRDRSLLRTAHRRPDMLAALLTSGDLDKRDSATLAGAGFPTPSGDVAK